ncbi:MAG: ClpXP protease specificity-enhancing factor [Acidiferrobacterales bacterium]|nr:ClpXP protease specificity-enhancing factor [Acidiferrobacterales bacterium]
MTSSRPYLIRALYEWITDNGLKPHILVNAESAGVEVPQQHVQQGRIVLNISHSAVHGLVMANDLIEFSARFGGVPYQVRIPTIAVMAIYAGDRQAVMVFGEEPGGEPPPSSNKTKSDKKPSLKIVK